MSPSAIEVAYQILAWVGVILCVWAMQLSGRKELAPDERGCIRLVRRLGLAILALGLLGSIAFGYKHSWTPWPPYLVILLGIDLSLLASVLNGYRHIAVAPHAKA